VLIISGWDRAQIDFQRGYVVCSSRAWTAKGASSAGRAGIVPLEGNVCLSRIRWIGGIRISGRNTVFGPGRIYERPNKQQNSKHQRELFHQTLQAVTIGVARGCACIPTPISRLAPEYLVTISLLPTNGLAYPSMYLFGSRRNEYGRDQYFGSDFASTFSQFAFLSFDRPDRDRYCPRPKNQHFGPKMAVRIKEDPVPFFAAVRTSRPEYRRDLPASGVAPHDSIWDPFQRSIYRPI